MDVERRDRGLLLRYHPSISLEGPTGTTKTSVKIAGLTWREMNLGSPEYNAEVGKTVRR